MSVDGIQVLANLKFIEAVVSFLMESIKPLTRGTVTDGGEGGDLEEEEEERGPALHHQLSTVSRSPSTVSVKESRLQISAKVVRPLVALLEDARKMNSAALVCQVN